MSFVNIPGQPIYNSVSDLPTNAQNGQLATLVNGSIYTFASGTWTLQGGGGGGGITQLTGDVVAGPGSGSQSSIVNSISGTISTISGTQGSIDFSIASLIDSSANSSIDWENRLILDNTAANSIDYNNRTLDDNISTVSVDWQNRLLSDSGGNTLVDFSGVKPRVPGIFISGSTSGTLTVNASATTTNHTITMPSSQGASNTFLKNNGSGTLSWASAGSGPVLTSGSVPFSDGATLTQDNADFFWDNTNKRLGLGTNTPGMRLDVSGSINQSISVTDIGTEGIQSIISSHTTTDGSNTTVGNQTAATGTVDATFTNDKVIAGAVNTITRGNGSDDGTLDTIAGVTTLTFLNSGAGGITNKYFGTSNTLFLQQGSITDAYDFYSETVPAGTGTVTNHYGIYIKPDVTTQIKNWLTGATQIGGNSFSTPTNALEISGNGSATGTFQASNMIASTYKDSSSNSILDADNQQINDATGAKAFDILNRLGISSDGTTIYIDGINRNLIRSDNSTAISWDASSLVDPNGNTKADWSNTSLPIKLETGVLLDEGHLLSRQSNPPTAAVQGSAGTGASASISNATDIAGKITIITGTIGISTGAYCKVSFDQPYNTAPIVVLTPAGSSLSTSVYVTSTINDFTINFAVAGGISTTYIINYYCIETQ